MWFFHIKKNVCDCYESKAKLVTFHRRLLSSHTAEELFSFIGHFPKLAVALHFTFRRMIMLADVHGCMLLVIMMCQVARTAQIPGATKMESVLEAPATTFVWISVCVLSTQLLVQQVSVVVILFFVMIVVRVEILLMLFVFDAEYTAVFLGDLFPCEFLYAVHFNRGCREEPIICQSS